MAIEIITKVIELGVLVLTGLIGKYLIPLLKEKVNFAYLKEIMTWTETFVKSAEMIVKGEKMGETKLNMVTEMMNDKLKETGVNFTDEQLRALIEEAVKNMQNQ